MVDHERRQAESQKSQVENKATRKRLNKLESAAAKFMEDKQEDDDASRDPNKSDQSTKLKEKGYTLNPPFVQLVCGHSQKFWLNIRQEAFPEFQVGSDVHIRCLSDEITCSKSICGLEPHPTQEDVLRAVWSVKAGEVTPATGISIKLEDIDLGNQRYSWRNNVLRIAARHPSLKRYLGPKSEDFPGQEKPHFRVILAEIVADAVCSKILEKREAVGQYDDEDSDWNFFYAEWSKLMTEFLPMAHSLQLQPSEA